MKFAERLLAGMLVFFLPQAAPAQEPPSETATVRHFVAAGASSFVGDFGEQNHQSLGPMARAGVQFPGSSLGLGFSFWGDVNRFRMASLQLELEQDLATRRRVTPTMFVGGGHTWGRYLGTGPASPPSGASAAFGLGLETAFLSRMAVDAELALRTDDGGWNAEWRLLGELRTEQTLRRDSSRTTSFVSSWMTPLGGPWVTVEPALGLTVHGGVGTMSLSLVHWQIPHERALGGWDTRGLIAAYQLGQGLLGELLHVRVGPAISAMGEGPDGGVRFGGQTDVVLGLDLGALRLESTAGILWLHRSGERDPSDQTGLIWSLGIGI